MRLILVMTTLSFLLIGNTYAQGCSDAGFCTIGTLKQGYSKNGPERKQKLSFLLSNGVGDEHVNVLTPGVQYDAKLNKHWNIQSRITGNFASGNLGKTNGFGDLIVSGTYNWETKDKTNISFLLATKLPLNNGNLTIDNKPLPMQYQSSLGTVDLIAGVTIANTKWLFAAAIQQPLTGRNRNTFLPVYWGTATAQKYSPSNGFNRKTDILIKTDYNLINTAKWKLYAGLLGIYHLGKDTYIDGNTSIKPIELNGSDGLTLNGTFTVQHQITSSISIGLSGGVPFVVRDIRPDGLTRKYVVTPEIVFHF